MIVECPNCNSTYNLEDGLVKPEGVKARCTVCEHVFVVTPDSSMAGQADAEPAYDPEPEAMPEEDGQESGFESSGMGMSLDLDEKPSPKKGAGGKKKIALVVAAAVLLLVVGGGAALYFMAPELIPGLDSMIAKQQATETTVAGEAAGEASEGQAGQAEQSAGEPAATGSPKSQAAAEAAPDVQNIVLSDIRQYYVDNDKAGRIFVVEGKAVNEFDAPKERIAVEVQLLDAQGAQLAGKTFVAGNTLDLYGLQNLSREKIEEALADEMGVASNNTNLAKGQAAPFMVVFFDSPAGVREFLVKVTDVRNPS